MVADRSYSSRLQELSVRLTAIAQHIESDAPSYSEVDQQDHKRFNGKDTQPVFVKQPNELKYRLYNGTIDYDFGFASLTSSTSYNTSDQTFVVDLVPAYGTYVNLLLGPLHPGFSIGLPGMPAQPLTSSAISPYQNQQTDLNKFTQEVRLASPSNDKFEWMVGLYYTHEEGKIDQLITSQDAGDGTAVHGSRRSSASELARLDSKYKEIAGFTNVTWHATDRFDITGGARWAQNKQSAHQVTSGPLAGVSDDTTEVRRERVYLFAVAAVRNQ